MLEVQDQASATRRRVDRDVARILIDRDAIASRIAELGAEIGRDLEALPGDVEVVLMPILTGSIIFVADLIRHLPQRFRLNVVVAHSYDGRTTRGSGDVIVGQIPDDLAGRFVLIIDDILDSGTTIRRIREEVERRDPSSVRACVLLRKTIPTALSTPCAYVGFDIPDEFVVGYGLDYGGYYRNLPDIGVLKKEAL